jgi:hypothetical protein
MEQSRVPGWFTRYDRSDTSSAALRRRAEQRVSLEPGSILASMLVSGIGFVLFKYGRSQRRMPQTAVGVLMLVYPYAVTDVPLMLQIGTGLLVLLFAAIKLGV